MAPKKIAEPRSTDGGGSMVTSLNGTFLQEMATMRNAILRHPKFKDLETADTLGFEDGARGRQAGIQSAFNLQDYKSAIGAHGIYRCAMNEFVLDPWFSMPGGIPYNRKVIHELAATSFSRPGQWGGTNIIWVNNKKFNPLAHKGSLKRLSPEEPNFARIIGIYKAIQENRDDELDGWRLDILCAPFQFEYWDCEVPADKQTDGAALPRAISLREATLAEAAAVGRDVLQRVFEVIKTRRGIEQANGRCTDDDLVKFYMDRIKMAPNSEAINRTFIEHVTTVEKRMLKDGQIVNMLMRLTEEWGRDGPLQSIYKLTAIIKKCHQERDLILWTLAALYDTVKSGQASAGEIAIRALTNGAGGGKGLVDLHVTKKQLQDYLFLVDLPKRVKTPETKNKILTILADHDSYRKEYRPYTGSKTSVDVTWMAGLAESEKMVLRLYEALLYTDMHDAKLRYQIRLNKTVNDMYQSMNPIKALFDALDDAAAAEVKELGTSTAQSMPGAPSSAAILVDSSEAAESAPVASDDAEPQDDKWRRHARDRIMETVKLIDDNPDCPSALTAALEASLTAKTPADNSGLCLIHMDIDLLTESAHMPHLRQPPWRKQQVERLLRAILTTRKDIAEAGACKLVVGDLLLFKDGGKAVPANDFWKMLTTGKGRVSRVAKQEGLGKISISVILAEKGLKERRSKVRGVGTLKQLVGLHCFHNKQTILPETDRKHFSGSNTGDALGPVAFVPWSSSWKLPVPDKRLLYGDNRRQVGGRAPGNTGCDDEDEDDADSDQGQLEEVGALDVPRSRDPAILRSQISRLNRPGWAAIRRASCDPAATRDSGKSLMLRLVPAIRAAIRVRSETALRHNLLIFRHMYRIFAAIRLCDSISRLSLDSRPRILCDPGFTTKVEAPIFMKGNTKTEPLFWWSMPVDFYQEVIHSYHASTIIDLSPGSGEFAVATLMNKPACRYLGVCFAGGHHQRGLMERLTDVYLEGMNDQKQVFYTPAYAADTSTGNQPTKGGRKRGKDEEPEPNKKPKPVKNKKLAMETKDPDQQEEEDEEPEAGAGEEVSGSNGSLAAILSAIQSP